MVSIKAQPPKSRLNFPFREPEQWWEIWHNTERSLAAQFAMIPVSAVAMNLLEEPSLADGFWKNFRKSFVYATYEYLENVFLRTTGAQTIRSWATLYSKDQKFQKCLHAGELLTGLTASAAHYDKEELPLVEELKNGKASSVHDFIFHSQDANQMLSDFVTGQMEVTPRKLKELEQHMEALAELSSQPIAMAQELRRSSSSATTPHSRPSDYIREVLEAKKLQNPRQLQILFSLVPPLITHGALALSHVEYVPQEKRFISVEQSVKLAKAIEGMMNASQYEYNHDLIGKPLVEGVSPSAIVKKERQGYRVLTQEELLQFGNRLLHQTKEIAGSNLNRILNYADEHYEAVEQQLLKSVYPQQSTKTVLSSQTVLTHAPAELLNPWKESEASAPHTHITNRWKSYMGAAVQYQSRDEAQHEKVKLYRRKLPNDFAKVPVTVVSDILKLTNADWNIFNKALKGDEFDSPFLIDKKTGKAKREQYKWGNHLRKEGWGILMKPLAGSFGLVSVKEFASTGKKLTGDSIRNLNKHLGAAIASGKLLDSAVQQSLLETKSALRQKKIAVPAALQAKVDRVQQKDPRHYKKEDFAVMQEYFSALSSEINQHSEKLLQPYQKQVGESLEDIIQRNALHPASDLPSALMSLSFVQSVLEKEKRNIDSLEFVDPKKNLIPLKSFRKIADYMEAQLTNASIAIVGQEYQGKRILPKGIEIGALVEFNPDSKRYEAVRPETIIRLANVVSKKFQQEIGANKERIAQGTIDKTHYAFVEKSLFEVDKRKQRTATERVFSGEKRWNAPRKIKHQRSFSENVTAAWKHATRAESMHEAKLLWTRTTFARFTGIPVSLWQNIRRGYVTYDKNPDNQMPVVKEDVTLKNIFNSKGKRMGSYISKGSLLSQLWVSVAYPIGGFVSVIGREMARYKVADTIADSAHASDSLTELLHKTPSLSQDWEAEYLAHTGKSAALEEAADQEVFKMIPRIAMKPAHLRLEHENQLMQQYMQQAGSVALASASKLMEGAQVSPVEAPLKQPATNLAEAHETLAAIKTVMDASRQHLGVLRYVDSSKIMLNSKALAQLSATIEGQYKAAEEAGDLETQEGYIRLSNVIRDEFIALVDMKKLKLFEERLIMTPQNAR